MSGSLEKIKITAFPTGDFSGSGGDSFTGLVNPASYKNAFSIEYTPRKELGGLAESPSFTKIGQEEISFDLVLDGTGIIPPPIGTKVVPVAKLINTLKQVVYTYNGAIHQPNFVEISWGDLLFNGRMSKMNIDYKMFTPGGNPLRATVNLSFIRFKSLKQASAEANNQSPDMTHIITVKEGDTLPHLCQKIYGKSSYYLQVARINHLSGFRKLQAGTELFFPPLN